MAILFGQNNQTKLQQTGENPKQEQGFSTASPKQDIRKPLSDLLVDIHKALVPANWIEEGKTPLVSNVSVLWVPIGKLRQLPVARFAEEGVQNELLKDSIWRKGLLNPLLVVKASGGKEEEYIILDGVRRKHAIEQLLEAAGIPSVKEHKVPVLLVDEEIRRTYGLDLPTQIILRADSTRSVKPSHIERALNLLQALMLKGLSLGEIASLSKGALLSNVKQKEKNGRSIDASYFLLKGIKYFDVKPQTFYRLVSALEKYQTKLYPLLREGKVTPKLANLLINRKTQGLPEYETYLDSLLSGEAPDEIERRIRNKLREYYPRPSEGDLLAKMYERLSKKVKAGKASLDEQEIYTKLEMIFGHIGKAKEGEGVGEDE